MKSKKGLQIKIKEVECYVTVVRDMLPCIDTKLNKFKKNDFEVGDIILLSNKEQGDMLFEVVSLELSHLSPLVLTFEAQHEFLEAKCFFGGREFLGRTIQIFIPMIKERFRKDEKGRLVNNRA